jgi:hypothetical protein
VSAISDMVAPAVLITLAAIFCNGLLTAGTSAADKVFALRRDTLGILRGLHGEVLDEASAPPADRERLMQIRNELPQMVWRVQRIRSAVVIIWMANWGARAERCRHRARRYGALGGLRVHGPGAGHGRGGRGVRWHRLSDRPGGQVG